MPRRAAIGANDANHDSPVALLAAALAPFAAALLAAACAPSPAAIPTVTVRDSASDLDTDADLGDAPSPAPVAPVSALASPSPASGPLVWLTSEEDAIALGRTERRPVLVSFATDWCADCTRMATETFGDPRVKTQAGRFVAVRIDATDDEDPQVSAALSKYDVVSVPTLILLDSSGHEQRRFTERIGPDTLLGEIDRVR